MSSVCADKFATAKTNNNSEVKNTTDDLFMAFLFVYDKVTKKEFNLTLF